LNQKGVKGIFTKLGDFLNGGEEEDETNYEEELENEEDEYEEEPPKRTRERGSNVHDINEILMKSGSIQPTTPQPTTPSVEVIRPTSQDECIHILELLEENVICIINFENTEDSHLIQRIADNLSGIALAKNCNTQRVNDRIFIIAPEGIPINVKLKNKIAATASERKSKIELGGAFKTSF